MDGQLTETAEEGTQRRTVTRRTVMIRAGLTGAATVWATPVVQTLGMNAAFAQGSPPPGGTDTGSITGSVVDATTASPIAGALVAVTSGGGASATTDTAGLYTIPNVPAGNADLQATAPGYAAATLSVLVPAGGSATADFALSPLGTGLRAVLTWGALPTDLDLHMSGPDGAGGRFHCAFYQQTPTDFIELDVDDVTSEGPETITISISTTAGGTFVAGSYHVWVHNFSTSPEFDASGARVDVFGLAAQEAQYQVSDATGNPADDIWKVVTFEVDAAGTVSNVAAQQAFVPGDSGSVF